MKNKYILEWIKETDFQCDATNENFKYQDLHIAWYDKSVIKDTKRVIYQDKFMLVKQEEGFRRLDRRMDDNWTLSSQPLEKIFNENVILFFTDLLVVDSIHDKGTFDKVTNLKSWTELFRRLTIPNYEQARHRLKERKQMDDFSELTEYQLLQAENLDRFMKSLN